MFYGHRHKKNLWPYSIAFAEQWSEKKFPKKRQAWIHKTI